MPTLTLTKPSLLHLLRYRPYRHPKTFTMGRLHLRIRAIIWLPAQECPTILTSAAPSILKTRRSSSYVLTSIIGSWPSAGRLVGYPSSARDGIGFHVGVSSPSCRSPDEELGWHSWTSEYWNFCSRDLFPVLGSEIGRVCSGYCPRNA